MPTRFIEMCMTKTGDNIWVTEHLEDKSEYRYKHCDLLPQGCGIGVLDNYPPTRDGKAKAILRFHALRRATLTEVSK